MTKKKFFLIILSVVLLVAAIDVGVGAGMRWYVRHCNIPGDYGKIEYMLKRENAQILLLGASTCMNSIDPEILEKELGKSVFNGGLNDQRLEFFDVMSDAVFRRSPPELLILVLRRNDLVISGRGRIAMLNIYYHCGNRKLDGCLEDGSLKRKILQSSALYRFNTFWWRILLYHFKSFNELAHGGFVGKPVPKIPPRLLSIPARRESPPVNPGKLKCLENILATCRRTGTKLWIVITPEYYKCEEGTDFSGASYIRDFCEKNHIPFIDDSRNPGFVDRPEYFFDNNHLNVNGAKIYTRAFWQTLSRRGIK